MWGRGRGMGRYAGGGGEDGWQGERVMDRGKGWWVGGEGGVQGEREVDREKGWWVGGEDGGQGVWVVVRGEGGGQGEGLGLCLPTLQHAICRKKVDCSNQRVTCN